ncbi:MAG: peroxide stress protein YaaA [Burkholderiaceae bacterium]
MLIVLSPAKSLNENPFPESEAWSLPEHTAQAQMLVKMLRTKSPGDLQSLMRISEPLARLNAERFQRWTVMHAVPAAKPAVHLFDGDVYDGLNAASLSADDLTYAQNHIRILSGLYGLLRPLDLIQPYRLEMGTALANEHGPSLYAFWRHTMGRALQAVDVLVNLASKEYFKAVVDAGFKGRVIEPVFQDEKNGEYKVIGFFAKKARGMMARSAIVQRVSSVDELKNFTGAGYRFVAEASSHDRWIFRRGAVGS